MHKLPLHKDAVAAYVNFVDPLWAWKIKPKVKKFSETGSETPLFYLVVLRIYENEKAYQLGHDAMIY